MLYLLSEFPNSLYFIKKKGTHRKVTAIFPWFVEISAISHFVSVSVTKSHIFWQLKLIDECSCERPGLFSRVFNLTFRHNSVTSTCSSLVLDQKFSICDTDTKTRLNPMLLRKKKKNYFPSRPCWEDIPNLSYAKNTLYTVYIKRTTWKSWY